MAREKAIATCTAVLITLLTLMLPGFIQPLITNLVSLQVISKDTELVQYLLEIQDDDDILLGIHGWEHKCAVCGENSHEFSCPYGKIDDSVIEYRVASAIKAFHDCGLNPDFWAFPGGCFDERSIAILRRYGFIPISGLGEGIGEAGEETEAAVCSSFSAMGNLPSKFISREYTMMWRDKTRAREEFIDAFKRANDQKPNVIISHVQDLNTYTFAWFDIILNHIDVDVMELHDVTVNAVEETKQFVELCRKHNVPTIILLIIPTHHGIKNPIHEMWATAYFTLFIITFEFPTMFFLSWYMFVRRKNQVA